MNASGECSGAEAVLLDHVDLALAEGIEVVVACPPGPLVARLQSGVGHVPLPSFGLGAEGRIARVIALLGLVGRTVRAAQILRPEVRAAGTHTVVNSLLALPAVRLARPARPWTWLVHDVVTSSAQRRFVSLGRGGDAGGLGLAVAVSEATARPLRALLPAVVVRANGVTWPVEPVALEVHDPPVVGSAALLVGWKGQLVLLEAIALLPNVRGELAGGRLPTEETYADALEARAAQPDVAGRVRLLGHVDAMEAMRGWDVAVLASLRPEAGPLAALEAMSIGLPVVATDHGGSAEYLADGRGVLVPPGDASALADGIRTALDAARRPVLARRARQWVADEHDRSRTLPAQYRAVMHGED